jgi:hypothetical protein
MSFHVHVQSRVHGVRLLAPALRMLVELGLVVWHYAMPSAYRLRASTVATEPTVATRYPARVTNFGYGLVCLAQLEA